MIEPETSFKGNIGVTAEKSIPDWPKPVSAPNIVVILQYIIIGALILLAVILPMLSCQPRVQAI